VQNNSRIGLDLDWIQHLGTAEHLGKATILPDHIEIRKNKIEKSMSWIDLIERLDRINRENFIGLIRNHGTVGLDPAFWTNK
jgi:hypothetical protein